MATAYVYLRKERNALKCDYHLNCIFPCINETVSLCLQAAEYLVRTGPTVTLEVAKQGAVLHGLATLLHQPAYNQRQGMLITHLFSLNLSRKCSSIVKTSIMIM